MAQRLPDELLEEIFVRLPAAADLARACTTCVSFRRVITGHPFLRRFRTLHPPPLLGILSGGLFPAQPPHPSAAAAATFADADFSCPFLPPSPDRWCRRDVRDGRALFSPRLKMGSDPLNSRYEHRVLITEFAVCDPLHRRYLLLPALPDHLAGLVHRPDIVECEPFLAPPGDDEDSSFRDFRVMCLVRCTTKLVLFVFSSCAGRMEFSTVDLPPPPGPYMRDMAIVESGEGRFGMLTISDQIKRGAYVYHLLYEEQCKDGNDANQWQTKSVIPLPVNYRYDIMGVAGGYLLLVAYSREDRHVVDFFH